MRTILFILFLLAAFHAFSQHSNRFPQEAINRSVSEAFQQSQKAKQNVSPVRSACIQPSGISAVLKKATAMDQFTADFKAMQSASTPDTVYVGDVPGDTLIITGNYTHTGPIFVFNDGVLIIHNAAVIDSGDIYVFQDGQLFADSSSLFFPQEYFYQRGLIAVQNGFVRISNCSLNYSGVSHNLVVGNHAHVELENIHQNDWTTCGLFGEASLSINGCNMGGEYILSDTSNATFLNTDTLILWHQFPSGSVIDFDFPAGDTVYHYMFNDSIPGVDGISYQVAADSCHNVMWAMMPVNGSDVTISNSTIRAIGAWFRGSAAVNVHGIFDNSSYSNYVTPLSDRNLHLINSDVQTWSLYAFDSAQIIIDSCQVGEVGCQQHASVLAQGFLLDGSGGYFWATDTSFISAGNVIIYSTARSERNGIFALAYSWLPFAAPSAVGNGLFASIQNNLAFDPVPYDNSVVWMQSVLCGDTLVADSVNAIPGKAWIDQGPEGGWMFFDHYSLYYQQTGAGQWFPLAINQTGEVHAGNLAVWNTASLPPGDYLLKLVIYNNLGDSIASMKPVTLVPAAVSIMERSISNTLMVFPVPAKDYFNITFFSKETHAATMEIHAVSSSLIYQQKVKINSGSNKISFSTENLADGIYNLTLITNTETITRKIIVCK
jgi:hypothetical protein